MTAPLRRELTLAEYRANGAATFYEAVPSTLRTVTLYGTLTGPIWQPGCEAQMPVLVDLRDIAGRLVNANGSGLVDAIRSVVDGAGDFRVARLTADSFVLVEHRRLGPPDGSVRYWARRIDVCDLPSLSDYVADDVYTAEDES